MNDIQKANNESAQESVSAEKFDETNPHILWKQILGLSIASIIFLSHSFFFYRINFTDILIVLAGIFTFIDAWKAGIYKRKDVKSFLNISPAGWAFAMEYLLIIVYPLYLLNRNKRKTKEGEKAFWILTIIFGGISFLLGLLSLASRIISVIATG